MFGLMVMILATVGVTLVAIKSKKTFSDLKAARKNALTLLRRHSGAACSVIRAFMHAHALDETINHSRAVCRFPGH